MYDETGQGTGDGKHVRVSTTRSKRVHGWCSKPVTWHSSVSRSWGTAKTSVADHAMALAGAHVHADRGHGL